MSNARNNILIVERDFIYMTEPDGRLIQTFGHRSVKQLYGIATFRDRYLLTIDSKATDHQIAENTRLLLFDPNSGQLVFEQALKINGEPEEVFREKSFQQIKGKILSETTSKPRFLAVHNDQIYIADLGNETLVFLRRFAVERNFRSKFDLRHDDSKPIRFSLHDGFRWAGTSRRRNDRSVGPLRRFRRQRDQC